MLPLKDRCGGLDALINGRVRLWALYVGALAEQRVGERSDEKARFSAEESCSLRSFFCRREGWMFWYGSDLGRCYWDSCIVIVLSRMLDVVHKRVSL